MSRNALRALAAGVILAGESVARPRQLDATGDSFPRIPPMRPLGKVPEEGPRSVFRKGVLSQPRPDSTGAEI